jgi:hypothetical protein
VVAFKNRQQASRIRWQIGGAIESTPLGHEMIGMSLDPRRCSCLMRIAQLRYTCA